MHNQFIIGYFNNSQDNTIKQFQTQLLSLTECLKSFEDVDKCIDFITDHPNDKFILVTDVTIFHSLVILTLDGLSQLIHVYVYVENDRIEESFEIESKWRKVNFYNSFDCILIF